MYSQFKPEIKVYKVYVLFQKFFLRESQPAGPITKTKK